VFEGPPPPFRARGPFITIFVTRAGRPRYGLLVRVINLLNERPVAINNLIEGDDLL
jgi:hypothetical protein